MEFKIQETTLRCLINRINGYPFIRYLRVSDDEQVNLCLILLQFPNLFGPVKIFLGQTKYGIAFSATPNIFVRALKLNLKFIYSEKATNFCEIFTLVLSYLVLVKSKVKLLQNFVAFSEYMNFTICEPSFSLPQKVWDRNNM